MSPENQATTPEKPTEQPRVTAAQEVIAKAAEQHPETEANFSILDAHVDALLDAADKGEITGSAGTYTREQLLDQFEAFLNDLHKPVKEGEKPVNPYMRIPGKDGLRASFFALMANDATARSFEESLRLHVDTYETKRAELLNPQNIQEMGEVEVQAAGVDEPMQEARRAAGDLINVSEPLQEQEGETDVQMYERFVREGRAELDDLYAQHRAATPGSWEADSLVNQIKNAKEDLGANARKLSQLKGEGKWH